MIRQACNVEEIKEKPKGKRGKSFNLETPVYKDNLLKQYAVDSINQLFALCG